MHKVGVMMMLKMKESPKKVKQIILEVEGKTKIANILEYLLEMGKIDHTNFQLSLEKNGRPISEDSNITQALKYTAPINGVIKLYLYEKGEYLNVTVQNPNPNSNPNPNPVLTKKEEAPAKVEVSSAQINPLQVQKQRQPQQVPKQGCCCCF